MDETPVAMIAAAMSADLVAGLVIGAAIGFLAGPILRHRLAYREWLEASREAELTDRLLTRLEAPDDLRDLPPPQPAPDRSDQEHAPSRTRWPTSR